MATIKKFEDLNSWQKSRELCDLIFEKLISNPEVRDYELINQINRSSGSVMDNIAEGFEIKNSINSYLLQKPHVEKFDPNFIGQKIGII